jgi:hypothetical protein
LSASQHQPRHRRWGGNRAKSQAMVWRGPNNRAIGWGHPVAARSSVTNAFAPGMFRFVMRLLRTKVVCMEQSRAFERGSVIMECVAQRRPFYR